MTHLLGAAALQCNGRFGLSNEKIEVSRIHSHLPDPADIEKKER